MIRFNLKGPKALILAAGATALFAAGCSSFPAGGDYEGNSVNADCEETAKGPRYGKRPVNATRSGNACDAAANELTGISLAASEETPV